MKTATEIATQLRAENPHARFAVSKSGDAVGLWSADRNAFVEIMMKTISPACPWVWLMDKDGTIHTTKCNGKPLYTPEDWLEVST